MLFWSQVWQDIQPVQEQVTAIFQVRHDRKDRSTARELVLPCSSKTVGEMKN